MIISYHLKACDLQSYIREVSNEHLKRRLHALDSHEAAGRFGPYALDQAHLLAPRARDAQFHPPDGRKPADSRPGGPEGPSEDAGVTAVLDEAKAAGAQARGIEAEQARMRDESVGDHCQAVLQTNLHAMISADATSPEVERLLGLGAHAYPSRDRGDQPSQRPLPCGFYVITRPESLCGFR